MKIPVPYRLLSALVLGVGLLIAGCVPVLVRDGGPPSRSQAGPAVFKIPPGHYPPPGQCRLWYPNRPPGHQPPPRSCGRIRRPVPAGTRLVRRPARHADRVQVSFFHAEKTGVRVAVGFYRIPTGERLQRE